MMANDQCSVHQRSSAACISVIHQTEVRGRIFDVSTDLHLSLELLEGYHDGLHYVGDVCDGVRGGGVQENL